METAISCSRPHLVRSDACPPELDERPQSRVVGPGPSDHELDSVSESVRECQGEQQAEDDVGQACRPSVLPDWCGVERRRKKKEEKACAEKRTRQETRREMRREIVGRGSASWKNGNAPKKGAFEGHGSKPCLQKQRGGSWPTAAAYKYACDGQRLDSHVKISCAPHPPCSMEISLEATRSHKPTPSLARVGWLYPFYARPYAQLYYGMAAFAGKKDGTAQRFVPHRGGEPNFDAPTVR